MTRALKICATALVALTFPVWALAFLFWLVLGEPLIELVRGIHAGLWGDE